MGQQKKQEELIISPKDIDRIEVINGALQISTKKGAPQDQVSSSLRTYRYVS